jgi:hypothetical protein
LQNPRAGVPLAFDTVDDPDEFGFFTAHHAAVYSTREIESENQRGYSRVQIRRRGRDGDAGFA